MLIPGHYHKVGNQWVAEIPLLHTVISSQPGAKRESLAHNMQNLATKSKLDINLISSTHDNKFFFEVKNVDQLLPIILKRTRQAKKLSIGDVTKKLGYASRNSYAQYEYGKTKLTFAKYLELITAMDPQAKMVLSTLH